MMEKNEKKLYPAYDGKISARVPIDIEIEIRKQAESNNQNVSESLRSILWAALFGRKTTQNNE